ncbi:hypothetical protein DICPUDRAFT_90514 [Dictyostelium purpureum]|uniref:EamA domain-containing protein n=1 Tax=Dictyostelium purpureum TaxID=5786 RepID=F1A325_DICPU|nr:uncharacterized protein DICPUDRAFT_90514 [Dictyostelium purpureum]EGC29401.1 hypothetical protein DICPUDRAFT_90514 [Dictyostelium purpureum]|eukprot:XP_003294072.1 hypothetical protein DICPUDRAFT_90514 [Dictyostelium purpureum]
MVNSMAIGYIASIVAIVGFGSNYVPVKKYPVGNGIAFAYFLSVGMFCCAFVAMGGSLWCCANLLVIPTIKLLGLGLAVLLYSSIGIVAGFIVGKAGLFGLKEAAAAHDWMNYLGLAGIILSVIFFFFIKPNLEEEKKADTKGNYHGSYDDFSNISDEEINSPLIVNTQTQIKNYEVSIYDRIPNRLKTVSGVVFALVIGILLGVNMIPMQLWKQRNPDANPLDYTFSQFSGIFLANTFVFILYTIIKRPPQIYPQTILPSFCSGVVLGVANIGLMISTENLGYTVGYPISCSGPMIVSSLWSIFYFREITGLRNFIILFVSFSILIGGIVLMALSSV